MRYEDSIFHLNKGKYLWMHRNRILHILPNDHFRTPIAPTAHATPIPFGPRFPRMRRPRSLTNNSPILRPITHIWPLLEHTTRPSPRASLDSRHLVIPRPPRCVRVCIPPSSGPIPVAVAAATAEVRVAGCAVVGCEGVHEGAQAEGCACYQGVVEVDLGKDRVADCAEGGVFCSYVFFEGGEVERGKYN